MSPCVLGGFGERHGAFLILCKGTSFSLAVQILSPLFSALQHRMYDFLPYRDNSNPYSSPFGVWSTCLFRRKVVPLQILS